MAVANDQVGEVLTVLLKYIDRMTAVKLLFDLRHTTPYERNQSFRETVNRLIRLAREVE